MLPRWIIENMMMIRFVVILSAVVVYLSIQHLFLGESQRDLIGWFRGAGEWGVFGGVGLDRRQDRREGPSGIVDYD